MKTTTLALLTKLGACDPAKGWAEDHPDPKEAWGACENGEWLEWLCVQLDIDVSSVQATHARDIRALVRFGDVLKAFKSLPIP